MSTTTTTTTAKGSSNPTTAMDDPGGGSNSKLSRKARERAAKLSRAVYLDAAVVRDVDLFPTVAPSRPPAEAVAVVVVDAVTESDGDRDPVSATVTAEASTETTAPHAVVVTSQSMKSRKPPARAQPHHVSSSDDDRSVGSLGSMSSLLSVRSRASMEGLYPKLRRVHLRVVARAILASRLPTFGSRVAVDAAQDEQETAANADDVGSPELLIPATQQGGEEEIEVVLETRDVHNDTEDARVALTTDDEAPTNASAPAATTTTTTLDQNKKLKRAGSFSTSPVVERLAQPRAMRHTFDSHPLDTGRTTHSDAADSSACVRMLVSEVSARLLQGIGHIKVRPEKAEEHRPRVRRRRRATKEAAGDQTPEGDEAHAEVDIWVTPDGQPWCPHCLMLFRNKPSLEKHKYSRLHEIAVHGGDSVQGNHGFEYDEGRHFKFIQSGHRLFLKPVRVNLDVDVFEHVPVAGEVSVAAPVLEIVLYEPYVGYELPRIYLDLGPRLQRVRAMLEDQASEVTEEIRQAIVRKSKYAVEVDVAGIREQERLTIYTAFVKRALRLEEVEPPGVLGYKAVFRTMYDPCVIARSCSTTDQLASLLRDLGIDPPTTADGDVDPVAARAAVPSLVMEHPPTNLRPAVVARLPLAERSDILQPGADDALWELLDTSEKQVCD
jgi:hypothetical protein